MSIYWFLNGDESNASSRIQGINVHNWLVNHKIPSFIFFKPTHVINDIPLNELLLNDLVDFFCTGDTIVFQKLFGDNVLFLIKKLKENGVKIVFVDCDLPIKNKIAILSDKIIVSSKELKKKYLSHGRYNIVYIEDIPEWPTKKININKKKNLFLWFGNFHPQRWNELTKSNKLIKKKISKNVRIASLSNSKKADYQYTHHKFRELASRSFCFVIPPPIKLGEKQLLKSANRVTQSLAYGLTCIVPNIPSYNKFIKNGYNGFIYNSDIEFYESMRIVLKNKYYYSFNAYKSINKECFMEEYNKWLSILDCNKSNKTSISQYIRLHRLKGLILSALAITKNYNRNVEYLKEAIGCYPLSFSAYLKLLYNYFILLFLFILNFFRHRDIE